MGKPLVTGEKGQPGKHIHVVITVTYECEHSDAYWDVVDEKYPFRYCAECNDEVDVKGKYPWSVRTNVVEFDSEADCLPCKGASGILLGTQQSAIP